jgi:hypothetical protein
VWKRRVSTVLSVLVALTLALAFVPQAANADDDTSSQVGSSEETITVNKVWLGAPGKSATVHLLANGEEVASATLTAEDGWTHTFKISRKTTGSGAKNARAKGVETPITYTVTEDAVDGYKSEVTSYKPEAAGYTAARFGAAPANNNSSMVFVVANVETIDIPVTEVWKDGDNGDGKRPASATVHLLADGEEVASATLTAEDGWTHTFEGMPKKDNNGPINYTLTGDEIAGYESEVSGNAADGFTVTNTQTTDISVNKVWYGDPAESATVHLLADGTEVRSATLNENNNWEYTFEDLPKYDSESNSKIVYSLTEDSIDGYTPAIPEAVEENSSTLRFTVKNTQTISVRVTKKWVGDPGESATVHLFANGEEVDSATLTADDGWTHTFEGLPKCDSEGNEIAYTLSEDAMTSYESEVSGDAADGFVVTNTKKSPAEPGQQAPHPSDPADPGKAVPKLGDSTMDAAVPVSVALIGLAMITISLKRRTPRHYRR